jgi:hypothetical protein
VVVAGCILVWQVAGCQAGCQAACHGSLTPQQNDIAFHFKNSNNFYNNRAQK